MPQHTTPISYSLYRAMFWLHKDTTNDEMHCKYFHCQNSSLYLCPRVPQFFYCCLSRETPLNLQALLISQEKVKFCKICMQWKPADLACFTCFNGSIYPHVQGFTAFGGGKSPQLRSVCPPTGKVMRRFCLLPKMPASCPRNALVYLQCDFYGNFYLRPG